MNRTPRRCDVNACTSPAAPPPTGIVPRRSGAGSFWPTLLAVALLVVGAPASLPAQERPGGSVERLDRVRVRAEGLDEGGEEFRLLRMRRDSLLLVGPGGGGVRLLAIRDVRRLEVRRETGGSHLLEGVIVGTGAGVLGYLAAVGSNDGPVENPGAHAAVTILPGAVLGAVVGAAIPDREWVAVEIGPAATSEGTPVNSGGERTTAGAGLSLRLELHPPWLP